MSEVKQDDLATALDGLREHYGDKHVQCTQCGNTEDMNQIIDGFEERIEEQDAENPSIMFTPEKLTDLLFRICSNCENLSLHELKDTIELEEDSGQSDESDSPSKSQKDASRQQEQTDDSDESTSSEQPFSI